MTLNSHFQKDQALILAQNLKSGRISRRAFVQGIGMIAGASAIGLGTARADDARQMVFVNWGGDAIKAMAEAFGNDFTKETGIVILYDGSGPTEGAITAQAQGGKPAWDMVDCDPFSGQAMGRKGFMRKIDWSVVDPAKIREGFQWDYAASSYFFSYIMAFDTTQVKSAPASMADFFDVEKFPGKRTLYKWGVGMWEAALLADGVKPEDLYPLDLDRAHKKIAAFKPHVAGYWASGAESQSMFPNGDASMGLIWSTRAMLLDKDSGGDIKMSWAQGTLSPGSSGVLMNNPGGAEDAMKYIASTQDPARQVKLFELLGNGPANPAADAMIPADQQQYNPVDPKNFALQVPLDMDWYENNYSAALDAYLGVISS